MWYSSFVKTKGHDDDCFYYHCRTNNVVIASGTLFSFRTYLHLVSGVVCVVCPDLKKLARAT